MKPLSATVVLSYFIYSELLPFYGIIREQSKLFETQTYPFESIPRSFAASYKLNYLS